MKWAFLLIMIFNGNIVFGQNKTKHLFDRELASGLENISDTIYIQNRHLLERLPNASCNGRMTSLVYRTKAGEEIRIEIIKAKFDSAKHHLSTSHMDTCRNCIKCFDLIDGKKAFGMDCEIPTFEIKKMQIKWGNKILTIPAKAYQNLFEPNLLDSLTEAYLTNDHKLLYLYISGSDGAGAYSAKLVFNHKVYLTRLVTTMEMFDQYEYLDQLLPNRD